MSAGDDSPHDSTPFWIRLERGLWKQSSERPLLIRLRPPLGGTARAIYQRLLSEAVQASAEGPRGRRSAELPRQELCDAVGCDETQLRATLETLGQHLFSVHAAHEDGEAFVRVGLLECVLVSHDGERVRATFDAMSLALWSFMERREAPRGR